MPVRIRAVRCLMRSAPRCGPRERHGCWACIQSAAACALLAAVKIARLSFFST
jgi:hypothetical protein